MSDEFMTSNALHRINWPGFIAGVLIVTVPFLGMWWRFMLGTGAFILAVSPFGVQFSIFGETVNSPLLWWVGLGLKLGVIYLGLLLVAGSVLSVSNRRSALAELLVRFSARKLLWLVIVFVAGLLIFILLVNQLPGMFGVPIQLQLPYLMGTCSFSTGTEGLRLTIPIFMGFTHAFAVAVVAAVLGFVALAYQKKLL